MIKKIRYLLLWATLSLTTTWPIFAAISCGWKIDKDNDLLIKEKEKWQEHKFNYPVMPEWTNLDINGQNEKEWLRFQTIYTQEIVKAKKQISEINQWLNEDKNDQNFHNFCEMVGGLTKIFMLWYQQIKVEIELNLWLISNGLTFETLLKSRNKFLLKKAEEKINLIVTYPNGLFNNWILIFNRWVNFMNLNVINKFERQTWEDDKISWLKVKNHLSLKNHFFKKQMQQIKKISF